MTGGTFNNNALGNIQRYNDGGLKGMNNDESEEELPSIPLDA